MSDNSIKRPGGITILAWLYLFGGGLWLLIGPYLIIRKGFDTYTSRLFTEHLIIISITTTISIIAALISYGLFKGKKWGWLLGVFPVVLIISVELFGALMRSLFKTSFIFNGDSSISLYIVYMMPTFLYCYIGYLFVRYFISFRVSEYFRFSELNDSKKYIMLFAAVVLSRIAIILFFRII